MTSAFLFWSDKKTHSLAGRIARRMGMTRKAVVGHAILEFAARRGIVKANAQHSFVPFETHGGDSRRDMQQPTPMGNQPCTPTPPSGDALSQGSVTDGNGRGQEAHFKIKSPTTGEETPN